MPARYKVIHVVNDIEVGMYDTNIEPNKDTIRQIAVALGYDAKDLALELVMENKQSEC